MREYDGVWKLMPYRKEKIWAGQRLDHRYGGRRTGEAYLFSDQSSAPCYLGDGTEFSSLWRRLGYGDRSLSLLVKAIDAVESLSVQVHPGEDPVKARKGKDELWLIDYVYPDAEVYIGFRCDVSEDLCRRRCEDGSLLSLLKPVTVSPGDVLWIPGGTIHGAKGISFYEIQSNCDVTYRLEDYGRGRELHPAEAFSVLDFSEKELFRGRIDKMSLFPRNWAAPFDLAFLPFRGGLRRKEAEPCVFLVLAGSGFCNGESFAAGDCFFMKDGAKVLWEGSGRLLRLGKL